MTDGLHIRVDRLERPPHCLLQGLDIAVPSGCVHTLMGPSGCGKSSLLSAVCGLSDDGLAFQGQVTLNGKPLHHLPVQQRRIGILYQDDLLFPHMNVLENLLFALPRGERSERQRLAQQALTDVELPDLADADPASLSGGQRSRVALARALLAQPQALLLDEPFSRLDAALRQRMRVLVFGLVARRGMATLLVTHDREDVADSTRLTHWPG